MDFLISKEQDICICPKCKIRMARDIRQSKKGGWICLKCGLQIADKEESPDRKEGKENMQ